MPKIKVYHKGNFNKSTKFLNGIRKLNFISVLNKYGQVGVEALRANTPTDSGKTASSWTYDVVTGDGQVSIQWNNTNINKGVNIAIILQYGHGTRNGGYVRGRDYINPAIQPIFDKIADEAWEEVVRL